MHAYSYISTDIYTYICINFHIHTHIHTLPHTDKYIHTYIPVFPHTYTHTHIHIYSYISTDTFSYIFISLYIHIHIYVHYHSRTYTYSSIYTKHAYPYSITSTHIQYTLDIVIRFFTYVNEHMDILIKRFYFKAVNEIFPFLKINS